MKPGNQTKEDTMYYLTNDLAVARNFAVELDNNGESADARTILYAAPVIASANGVPPGSTALYLSTNGDPVLLAIYAAANAYGHNVALLWITEDADIRQGIAADFPAIDAEDDSEAERALDALLVEARIIT